MMVWISTKRALRAERTKLKGRELTWKVSGNERAQTVPHVKAPPVRGWQADVWFRRKHPRETIEVRNLEGPQRYLNRCLVLADLLPRRVGTGVRGGVVDLEGNQGRQ